MSSRFSTYAKGHIAEPKKVNLGGRECIRVGLAENRREKVNGEWVDIDPQWWSILLWPESNSKALAAAYEQASMWGAGDVIEVEGRLDARTYTGNDGEPRVDLQIKPWRVEYVCQRGHHKDVFGAPGQAPSGNSAPVDDDEIPF